MTACLDCGRPGQRGSRCDRCEALRRQSHDAAYGADYQRESARVRREAGTHCPRCGRPYTPDNPPTAGHLVAVREGGTLEEGLEAQCRKCNFGWKKTGL